MRKVHIFFLTTPTTPTTTTTTTVLKWPLCTFDSNIGLRFARPSGRASSAALLTLWFMFKSFSLYIKPKFAFICILPLVFMPGFWIKIQYFRPDWILACLTLGCTYFLLQDKGLYRKSYWIGIVFFGLAISTKTQALFFLPILGLAPIMPALLNPNWINIKAAAVRLLKSVGVVVGVFFTLNPHTLHPIGMYGFTRRFDKRRTYQVLRNCCYAQPWLHGKAYMRPRWSLH